MIITITTFHLKQAATLDEITETFRATRPSTGVHRALCGRITG
jgi:hypothetical protein